MAQMPEIKFEVNKEPERDKKRGGFFTRLFGGGGAGGGTVGAGGFGAGGGGLLATKTGMLAMLLVGTTVAGGIGMVGYRMFGPGSEQGDGSVSLFAVKPKEAAAGSDAQNAAPKDGSSASLQYLSQANTTPKEPDAKPAEAPKDASAAGAATSADAAAAGGANGPINASGSAGNGVNKGLLKTGGKFGELSKNFGGGGGGSVVSAAPAKSGAASDAAALAGGSRNGATTGMKKGVAAMGGGSRAVASRKGANSGMRQALGALADNRGATTSYGAGRTYDGSAPANSGNIGPTGGEIGMGGQGDTTGAQPTSTPNTANQAKEFKAPPTPNATMAAPWQNAIDTAKMLVGLSVALLLVAKLLAKQKPYGHLVAMVVAAIVGLLGAMVISIGAQISGGQYGQKAQGAWLAAAGIGLCIAAAATAFGGEDGKGSSETNSGLNTDGSVASTAASSGDSAKDAGFFAGVNTWVLIGGGLGLAGMIGSMMTPPQKYPSKQFENGQPPDMHFFGYQAPSDAAVKKMVA